VETGIGVAWSIFELGLPILMTPTFLRLFSMAIYETFFLFIDAAKIRKEIQFCSMTSRIPLSRFCASYDEQNSAIAILR
jgi:hypothetical protein